MSEQLIIALISAIGAIVAAIVSALINKDKLPNIFSKFSRHQKQALPSIPIEDPSMLETAVKHMGVTEIFRSPISHSQVSTTIYKQAKLDLDERMKIALHQLNKQRESQNRTPLYANLRYRIIRPPYIQEHQGKQKFVLELGETDFTYFTLLSDDAVDSSTKEYVKAKVQVVANRVPTKLHSTHPYFNASNVGQLGVQMVLITTDGYTLLRRRSNDVLEYPEAWDVAFSGYCGSNALNIDKKSEIDIWRTVNFELEKEIGIVQADPRDIVFTGLHRNSKNGTTVMLGYWKIQATRAELASNLNEKYPNKATVFDTTIKAEETYVWRSLNLIAKFDSSSLTRTLRKSEKSLSGNPVIMVPAARASLLLALSAYNKSTVDLESWEFK